MIIECPECGTKNQTDKPPEPGKVHRCGNCKAVITFLQTDDAQSKTTDPSITDRTGDAAAERTSSHGHSVVMPKESGGWNWTEASAPNRRKTGLISKARTGTGRLVQIIGVLMWGGCGLFVFVWTLYVLFSTFGIWTIFVGLFLAPITYIASIFIIWFSTGIFPVLLLLPYIGSFFGIVLLAIGGAISGED